MRACFEARELLQISFRGLDFSFTERGVAYHGLRRL